MNIRAMKPTDFNKICKLWEIIDVQFEEILSDLEKFPLMLKMNPSSCFVVEENGEIIGSIFGLFNGRRAWIHHFGIHPDWQGKDIGTKLLKYTEMSLKKRGAQRVLLSIDLQNLPVQNFYRKFDYKVSDDCVNLAKNL